jgi:hypothetical protein
MRGDSHEGDDGDDEKQDAFACQGAPKVSDLRNQVGPRDGLLPRLAHGRVPSGSTENLHGLAYGLDSIEDKSASSFNVSWRMGRDSNPR